MDCMTDILWHSPCSKISDSSLPPDDRDLQFMIKRKTQKRSKTTKDTKLPQTSIPQDLRADDAVHKEGGDSVERAITTTDSLDAAYDSNKVIRTQTMAMPNVDILQGMDTGVSPHGAKHHRSLARTRSERVLEKPNEPPLSEGRSSGSREGKDETTI
ncbi:hypothetical protein Tco_0676233 [Tanacetum coccineum]